MLPTAPPEVGGGAQPPMKTEEVRSMLAKIITNARRIASENGINFDELVNASGGSGKQVPPVPPPM